MAIGDIYALTYVSQVNGQRVINTMHLGEEVACTDTIPAQTICAAWEDVFLPLLLDCLSEEASVQCIYCRRIRPTFNIPFLVVETASPGVVVSHAAPANAAAVLSFYTAEHSRSGRGRQYISGIPESKISDGQMEVTQVTALEAFADLFLVRLEALAGDTGEWQPIVYSPTLVEGNTIIARVVSPSMGSMRSRRQPYGMIP